MATHSPEESVQSTRLLAKEIPRGIVCRSGLWDFSVWHGLHRMDKIWEKYRVLDKEHRDIVPHNVWHYELATHNE